MSLASGSRLGPYEILAPLGAGGMGEVYKARDTRLDRTVAVKVLAAHLSESEALRQRFEREARAVANLSHPHIAALYDVGRHEGTDYLVMEYLEGETLAERLRRGALPMEQVLRHGIEIADALDKAHRSGIVHRDLKPGNVMLTKSGAKLLDFGLARSRRAEGQEASALSSVPTQEKPLTEEGTILGTLPYMAPEQLEGKEADARTDVFALGAVLYEMATGRRAFEGKNRASLIAAILEHEPAPMTATQPLAPPDFEHVVKTCLAKDPDERWQSAHDVTAELRWIGESRSRAGPAVPAQRGRGRREALAWSLAALGALCAAFLLRRHPTPDLAPVRLSVLPPENAPLASAVPLVLSPDGRRLVLVVRSGGKARLWLRSLDGQEEKLLEGTEGAADPFWSPDGRWLGFFADRKLRRLDTSNGTIQNVCDAPAGRGGSFGPNGSVLFSPTMASGLMLVSASGGAPRSLTRLDPARGDLSHRWPLFLPDGERFLVFVDASGERSGLYAGSLKDPTLHLVLSCLSNAALLPSGHLVYRRDANLVAQRFDPDNLRVTGEPVVVARGVDFFPPFHSASFCVSANGVLAYHPGWVPVGELALMSRDGRRLGVVGEPGFYRTPRLSHDGRQVVATVFDPETREGDLWIYDLERDTRRRFTFAPSYIASPVWSPDDKRIVYASRQTGFSDLYVKDASGATPERPLLLNGQYKAPTSWSRSGLVAFDSTAAETGWDLWTVPESGGEPREVLKTPFNEVGFQFAPDGRSFAYESDEAGRQELYLRSFPGPGGAVPISPAGGTAALWRGDGKELYFWQQGKLWAVDVTPGDPPRVGAPHPLFDTPSATVGAGLRTYDMTQDGQRFLLNLPQSEPPPSSVTVLLYWASALP